MILDQNIGSIACGVPAVSDEPTEIAPYEPPGADFGTPRKAWERLPDEDSFAFLAFTFYRDLGLDRTVEKAELFAHEHTPRWKSSLPSSLQPWYAWSREYRWRERAEEYDLFMDAEKCRALTEAIRRDAEMWVQRKQQQREEAYHAGREAFVEARRMITADQAAIDTSPDGAERNTTAHGKLTPRNLSTAFGVVAAAHEVIMRVSTEAVDEAKQLADMPDTPTEVEARYAKAAKRLQEWRAAKKKELNAPDVIQNA